MSHPAHLGLPSLLWLVVSCFFAPAPFWRPSEGGGYLGAEFAGNDLSIKTVFIASPALKSGLSSSDMIVAVDGTKLRTPAELGAVLKKKKAGDMVSVTVLRQGEQMTVKVTLDPPFKPYLGVSFANDLRVIEIVDGGPAQRAGLRTTDVIVAVDAKRVMTPDELVAVLRERKAGGVVALAVQRNGEDVKVRVKLGKRPGY
jgi:S1-C subfamily serine protease